MMVVPAATTFVIIFLVAVGGVGYYTYAANSTLAQENASLHSQLMQLQNNFNALKYNQSLIQAELSIIRTSKLAYPLILLRTWGTALASYGTRLNGVTYLRLTETGPNSGVEAALASTPFNATIAGASVQWSAWANKVATDRNHTIWPMVLENSPGGTDAIEFEMKGGYQEVAVVSHGVRSYASVYWNASQSHVFKIVVVTPGARVDFYIDGHLVVTLTANVPKVGFLLDAAEVKADTTTAKGVATLDAYGGVIGNPSG